MKLPIMLRSTHEKIVNDERLTIAILIARHDQEFSMLEEELSKYKRKLDSKGRFVKND